MSTVPPRALAGPAVLAAALGALLIFGVAGIGRGSSPWQTDLDYFWVAGRLWAAGDNPYVPETFTAEMQRVGRTIDRTALSYPPQFAPLAMLLGSLPLPAARWLAVAIGLASLGTLAWLAVRLVAGATGSPVADLAATRWLLPALVLGSPFAAHLLWIGQVTPLAIALLVGGWVEVRRGREVWGGVLLGLATFKPHLALLPLFWLLLERRAKALAVAAGVSAACAVPGLGLEHPLGVLGLWLRAVPTYQADAANRLGGEFVVGIPSALAAVGVPMPPLWTLPLLGVLLTAGLWLFRRRLDEDDVLAWLVLVQCLGVWVHSNDLVMLVPVAAALWRRLAVRQELWLPGAAGLAALYFPQRIVRAAGWLLLHHWRTLVVALAALALARLARRDPPAQRADG
ncbi:MAG TPA: glycosyltransferase family 87 protein [Thermoanaerobaculaceae bacterium]|nr:glycosyltransferase family 87 protein [Thermoanaerobaculaceae bacterium]HRS14813.1 glycosyltransferase family 87 protein [Thermoanaerobaculaceae bacterium]